MMATTKGLMGYSSDLLEDFEVWTPTKPKFDTDDYLKGLLAISNSPYHGTDAQTPTSPSVAYYEEYRKVLADYNELQKKYSDLQTKYGALQNDYIKLASSLINCQSPLDEEENEKIKII